MRRTIGTEAHVWIWLPGATEPVVAGRLEAAGDVLNFQYAATYLLRADAVALYLPGLAAEVRATGSSGRCPCRRLLRGRRPG